MNVTMPAWCLALAFAVSAGVGYASCYFGVVKIGAAIMGMGRPRNGKADTMTETSAPTRRTVTAQFVILAVLLGMLLVIAGGTAVNYYRARQAAEDKATEQAADKAAQMAYDECLTEWGDELVGGINDSRAARREYDDAASHRDDATAKVLAVSLGFFTTPPQSDRAELQRALLKARRADERVKQAKATLDSTQTEYQPPTLACADQPQQEEPDP